MFEIHSHFLHGTWACIQGHTSNFSTHFSALGHVPIVQILFMHINALKTQLMHKNVQTNPENSKNWRNTPVVLCWHEKFFESNKRKWISFHPKRWGVLYQNQPQMGQKFYHIMLVPFHDIMPSFMNFRRVFDLLEFKNQVSQCLRPSDGGRVFDIHSHFLHGT